MQITKRINLIGTRLYQWDTDRAVVVTPQDGETIEKVEFANIGDSGTLPVKIKTQTDGTVMAAIPAELLQTGRNIDAYAIMSTENGERTRYHKPLSVESKPKPPGYAYTPSEVKRFEDHEDRIKRLEKNGGGGGGSVARIGNITLLADKWDGSENLYSQVVSVDGATENSQVDLTPSVEQLAIFYEKDLAFVTENEDGVVTVYAIGQKPQNDYTMQVTITEVDYE